jgi:hypothetical protein
MAVRELARGRQEVAEGWRQCTVSLPEDGSWLVGGRKWQKARGSARPISMKMAVRALARGREEVAEG